MKLCGTQHLETVGLILRRFVAEDAVAMYRNWALDDEVTKYFMWSTHANIEVSKMVIKEWEKLYSDKNNYYNWAIVLKENGDELIGGIGVVNMNEAISMVHIGYCIGRSWWNKGITSEVLKVVMDFLFDVVEVNRIEQGTIQEIRISVK